MAKLTDADVMTGFNPTGFSPPIESADEGSEDVKAAIPDAEEQTEATASEAARARVVVVVPSIPHHDQRSAVVDSIQVFFRKTHQTVTQVGVVITRGHACQDLNHRLADILAREIGGDILYMIDESECMGLVDLVLQAVNQAEHQFRAKTHGCTHVTNHNQLRLQSSIAMLDDDGYVIVF